MKILVLEDEAAWITLIKEMVVEVNGRLDGSTTCCTTVAEAAKHIENVDIILADLNVPDSSPEDTIEWLKKWRYDLPAVIITGDDRQEMVDMAAEAGWGFLLKDCFSARMLAMEIRKAIIWYRKRKGMAETLDSCDMQLEVLNR
jgi:CheY-like chemotaxis protein